MAKAINHKTQIYGKQDFLSFTIYKATSFTYYSVFKIHGKTIKISRSFINSVENNKCEGQSCAILEN